MTGGALLGMRLPEVALPLSDHTAVAAYVAAARDDNPLHRDQALARAAGYDDILVPGMLIMGQMAERLEAWPHCAAIGWFLCRFVDPVVAGTALHCQGRVVAADPSGGYILRLTALAGRRHSVVGEALIRQA